MGRGREHGVGRWDMDGKACGRVEDSGGMGGMT